MGFCKSDQKNIPVVGFLTHNDCDVLRDKTGLYRRVTHRTIILPTTDGVTQKGNSAGGCNVVARASRMEGRPRVVPECPRAQRRGEGVRMEKCWSGKM